MTSYTKNYTKPNTYNLYQPFNPKPIFDNTAINNEMVAVINTGNPSEIIKFFSSKLGKSLKDSNNNSPIHLLINVDNNKLNETQKINIIRQIIKPPFNVGFDSQNNDYLTPLHLAVKSQYPELVKYLLKKGADGKKVNNYHQNILHLALIPNIKECDKEIVPLPIFTPSDVDRNVIYNEALSVFYNNKDIFNEMIRLIRAHTQELPNFYKDKKLSLLRLDKNELYLEDTEIDKSIKNLQSVIVKNLSDVTKNESDIKHDINENIVNTVKKIYGEYSNFIKSGLNEIDLENRKKILTNGPTKPANADNPLNANDPPVLAYTNYQNGNKLVEEVLRIDGVDYERYLYNKKKEVQATILENIEEMLTILSPNPNGGLPYMKPMTVELATGIRSIIDPFPYADPLVNHNVPPLFPNPLPLPLNPFNSIFDVLSNIIYYTNQPDSRENDSTLKNYYKQLLKDINFLERLLTAANNPQNEIIQTLMNSITQINLISVQISNAFKSIYNFRNAFYKDYDITKPDIMIYYNILVKHFQDFYYFNLDSENEGIVKKINSVLGKHINNMNLWLSLDNLNKRNVFDPDVLNIYDAENYNPLDYFLLVVDRGNGIRVRKVVYQSNRSELVIPLVVPPVRNNTYFNGTLNPNIIILQLEPAVGAPPLPPPSLKIIHTTSGAPITELIAVPTYNPQIYDSFTNDLDLLPANLLKTGPVLKIQPDVNTGVHSLRDNYQYVDLSIDQITVPNSYSSKLDIDYMDLLKRRLIDHFIKNSNLIFNQIKEKVKTKNYLNDNTLDLETRLLMIKIFDRLFINTVKFDIYLEAIRKLKEEIRNEQLITNFIDYQYKLNRMFDKILSVSNFDNKLDKKITDMIYIKPNTSNAAIISNYNEIPTDIIQNIKDDRSINKYKPDTDYLRYYPEDYNSLDKITQKDCIYNTTNMIDVILNSKKLDYYKTDVYGFSPIYYAILSGNHLLINTIMLKLSNPSNLVQNQINKFDESPIKYAYKLLKETYENIPKYDEINVTYINDLLLSGTMRYNIPKGYNNLYQKLLYNINKFIKDPGNYNFDIIENFRIKLLNTDKYSKFYSIEIILNLDNYNDKIEKVNHAILNRKIINKSNFDLTNIKNKLTPKITKLKEILDILDQRYKSKKLYTDKQYRSNTITEVNRYYLIVIALGIKSIYDIFTTYYKNIVLKEIYTSNIFNLTADLLIDSKAIEKRLNKVISSFLRERLFDLVRIYNNIRLDDYDILKNPGEELNNFLNDLLNNLVQEGIIVVDEGIHKNIATSLNPYLITLVSKTLDYSNLMLDIAHRWLNNLSNRLKTFDLLIDLK